MIKEWFVLVQGKKEGPFSLDDLEKKIALTPDTLVWKKDFRDWKKAGEVQELRFLFKEPVQEESEKEKEPKSYDSPSFDYAQVMDMSKPPGNWIWWVILFILSLLYAVYNLY